MEYQSTVVRTDMRMEDVPRRMRAVIQRRVDSHTFLNKHVNRIVAATMSAAGLFLSSDAATAFCSAYTTYDVKTFISSILKPAHRWFVRDHVDGGVLFRDGDSRVLPMNFMVGKLATDATVQ